jgi:PGF-CTERM protein
MKGDTASNSMTNFDFENTWRTVTGPDGFPQLQWVPTGTSEDGGDGSDSGDGSNGGGSDGGDGSDGGSGDTSSDDSGPGFGVGGALAGVTGAGYLLKHRLRGTDEE